MFDTVLLSSPSVVSIDSSPIKPVDRLQKLQERLRLEKEALLNKATDVDPASAIFQWFQDDVPFLFTVLRPLALKTVFEALLQSSATTANYKNRCAELEGQIVCSAENEAKYKDLEAQLLTMNEQADANQRKLFHFENKVKHLEREIDDKDYQISALTANTVDTDHKSEISEGEIEGSGNEKSEDVRIRRSPQFAKGNGVDELIADGLRYRSAEQLLKRIGEPQVDDRYAKKIRPAEVQIDFADPRTLFVRKLPIDTTNAELTNRLAPFRVLRINRGHRDQNKLRTWCFVTFETRGAAMDVLDLAHGKGIWLNGARLQFELAK